MRSTRRTGRIRLVLVAAAAAAGLGLSLACSSALRPTVPSPPGPELLAELWIEPRDLERRDLYYGAGGPQLAPEPNAVFDFEDRDTTGFSSGYDVEDAEGVEWDAKFGPEAQTEVVASRIIWAVGYHQPPTYYLANWRLRGASEEEDGDQPAARFRPEPSWMEPAGGWSWQCNPFVGTRPFRGLIVLNLMLNNSDLKTSNNEVYELDEPRQGVGRWFVVKDVGHSFGRTGRVFGTRNDLAGFQEHGFIERIEGNRVVFEYHGLHRELLDHVGASDVRWMSELLARLTDRQWRDAFRAASYDEERAAGFIARMKEKIREGLAIDVPVVGGP